MAQSTLRGVNLVGGEYPWGTTSAPKEGQHYQFVSDADIDYLAAKGVKCCRLVFSWELLQPALKGPLAIGVGQYGATLRSRIAYLRQKGIKVLIEPHGGDTPKFARYKGNLVGTAAVPNDAFADLWSRLASLYKADPAGVLFGLSNEPNNMSTMQWFQAAQAAVLAIRATKAKNWIVCPGNGWSGASGWGQNWYDTASPKLSNQQGWAACIKDPLARTMVGVHCYFDQDRGGADETFAKPFCGVQDLIKVVEWARVHGLKVYVGEFGASPKNPDFDQNIKQFLDYCDQNRAVVEGWAWWAYGPISWWGGYRFTLCPSADYKKDAAAFRAVAGRFTPPVRGVKPI